MVYVDKRTASSNEINKYFMIVRYFTSILFIKYNFNSYLYIFIQRFIVQQNESVVNVKG